MEKPWRDKDAVERLYIEQGLTVPEIAERWDCSVQTVNRWRKKHGVKMPWRDADKLESLYKEELLTVAEIAEKWSCDESTIGRWLDKHNIEKRTTAESVALASHGSSVYRKVTDSDWLKEKYWDESLSLAEISDELGVTTAPVHGWMKRHDIPRRGEGGREGENHHCWNDDLDSVCEICGTEFHKGGGDDRGRFCSIECKAEWQSEAYRGEGSPNWNGGYKGYYGPNWSEQREKALERDNYMCQRCGMESSEHHDTYGTELHIHHISNKNNFDDYSKMNALSNLVALCARCHKLLEGLPIDRGDR